MPMAGRHAGLQTGRQARLGLIRVGLEAGGNVRQGGAEQSRARHASKLVGWQADQCVLEGWPAGRQVDAAWPAKAYTVLTL